MAPPKKKAARKARKRKHEDSSQGEEREEGPRRRTPRGQQQTTSSPSRTRASSAGPSTPNPPAHQSQQGSAPRARTRRTRQKDGADPPCRTVATKDDRKQARGPYSFLDFPPELRNIIYDLVLVYPTCSQLYSVYYSQIAAIKPGHYQTRRVIHRKFHTPTILLLCRRITQECLPILRSRTLVIDRLPPFRSTKMWTQEDGGGTLSSLCYFVPRATLQNLQHLDLRVGVCEGSAGSAWLWRRLVDELCDILSERNRLVTLRFVARVCNPPWNSDTWDSEQAHMIRMKNRIVSLSDPLRGRPYSTSNPFSILFELWCVDEQRATFELGSIYETPYSVQYMEARPDVFYPDPELFPGSITEFVESLPPVVLEDSED